MIRPVFAAVAAARAGEVRCIKVNTEDQPALSSRFRIRNIPTIMLYRNGQRIDMLNGAMPQRRLKPGWMSSWPSRPDPKINQRPSRRAV